MKIPPVIIVSSLVVALRLSAGTFDEAKPHGRACVAVVDSSATGKEEAFRSTDTPRPGKRINVYLDASTKCTTVVAALRKDGKLANDWRPQVVELAGDFEDIQVPKSPATWDWSDGAEPFDFYILFLSPGAKESDELKKLVSAMQSAKADQPVLAMQTNKLREILSRIAAEKDRGSQVVSDPEIGGVFRGSAFPWRQYANGANFSSERAGVIIIPSSRGPETKDAAVKP